MAGRSGRMPLTPILLAALVATGPAPHAGSEAPAGVIERVETELVLIEAYVTDARGRPIAGLTADDFILSVDGTARPITTFEFVRLPGGNAVPAWAAGTTDGGDAPATAAPARRFMLFFNDCTSDPQGMTAARRAAQAFLGSALAPSDQVALAAYDTGLHLLHDFTTDREALRTAIAGSLEGAKRVAGLYAERRARKAEIDRMLEEYEQKSGAAGTKTKASAAHHLPGNQAACTDCGRRSESDSGGGGGNPAQPNEAAGPRAQAEMMMDQELKEMIRQMKHLAIAYAGDETPRLRAMLRGIGTLVDGFAGWRGHKALVFMGDGIPENAALPYVEAITREHPDSFFATRALSYSLAHDIDAVRHDAMAAGITIHTLRSGGLLAGTAEEMKTAYGNSNTMVALALGTGGLRGASNDLLKELRAVEDASRSYYVLGHTPEGEPDGRHHAVQVRCRRRGSSVRAREGFVRFTAAQARERTLRAAHVLPDLYRELPIDLSLALGPVAGRERLVDLVIHVPAGGVQFLPDDGRPTARLSVGLLALEPHGGESLRVARTVHVARPAEGAAAGGVAIYCRARLPDREHLVTAVVRDDATGVVGAIRVPLHGSEDHPQEIEGLSLYSPAESSLWIEIPAGGGAGNENREPVGHVVGPPLKTTFAVGEVPVLGFRRPDGGPASGGGLIVVIRRSDAIVRSIDVAPPGDGTRPTVQVSLPVQGLPAGEYTVAVQSVVDGAAVDRATVPLRLREAERMAPES